MRMKRFSILLALLVLVFAMPAAAQDLDNSVDTTQLPDSSFVYETSIYELQNSDTYYEGQTVQVTGEAVGDIIDGDDDSHKWITLDALESEQAATVQVYVSAEQVSLIDTLGRYEQTGSTVSVTGKYHLVCDQHEGLSDIHASSLEVMQAGSEHHQAFSYEPFLPALALLAAGLLLYWMYRRKCEELR